MSDSVTDQRYLNEKVEALKNEFLSFATWEERYKHLIQRGKKLGDLADNLKDEDHKVKGCQSQVWLYADLQADGKIVFRADSDAMIVKGLASVLVDVYSGANPDEILATSPQFLKDLGFDSHLSPNRANGLFAMAKQIMFYATAFRAMQSARSR